MYRSIESLTSSLASREVIVFGEDKCERMGFTQRRRAGTALVDQQVSPFIWSSPGQAVWMVLRVLDHEFTDRASDRTANRTAG